jgi:hypothetical protein
VGLRLASFSGSFAARNVLAEADEPILFLTDGIRPSRLIKIIGKPLIF